LVDFLGLARNGYGPEHTRSGRILTNKKQALILCLAADNQGGKGAQTNSQAAQAIAQKAAINQAQAGGGCASNFKALEYSHLFRFVPFICSVYL
jgi:hypothetical protein